MRQIWFIADDFGIAPGVDEAIVDLLASGRLSGTGCMTVFPEWPVEARRLDAHHGKAGLHLTLTDQPALTGRSKLAPLGKLPGLGALVRAIALRQIADADVHRELDAQFAAFVDAVGAPPAFIDGHQHVHFLPPVRRWLRMRGHTATARSWLRGAPLSARAGVKTKVVAAMAARFGPAMRAAGYTVRGPLSGFYDWSKPDDFGAVVDNALPDLPAGAVFMCHPGVADQTLRARDPFTEARKAEYEFMRSDRFSALLARQRIEVAQS